MTITLTINPTIQKALLLKNVPMDALAFLKEMAKQNLFTPEQKILIHDLIENFDPKDAPELLVIFLSDIIYSALETSEDEIFIEIEENVKKILCTLLPPKTDINAFIKRTIAQSDKDLALIKQAEKVSALVEQRDDELCVLGDQINRNIEECHDSLKNRLLTIIQIKEQISEEDVNHSNQQVEKINRLKVELEAIVQEYQKIGADYKQQQLHYQDLLRKSHELVRSVRR